MTATAVSAEAPVRSASLSVGLIFLVSGVPALLYQIVWQRALFAIYGIDSASVTAVVAAFMLGLGLGSLLGGHVSTRPGAPLLLLFGLTEAVIGVFGYFSLAIFARVGEATLGASALGTGALAFLLVVLPTVLMGATLPLLTTYLVRRSGSVGASLGILYFVNTLGAACACFLAAVIVMRTFGMQGTVNLAALLNLAIGAAGVAAHFALRGSTAGPAATPTEVGPQAAPPPLSLGLGVVLSACTGFISLSYEILWIRTYAYASGGHATGFALLLGAFLTGIAFGSLLGRRVAARLDARDRSATLATLGRWILVVNLVAFALVPWSAFSIVYAKAGILLVYTVLASLGFGILFPVIAHATVPPDALVGRRVSFLYVANIAGSTLGSLSTGFLLMDVLGFKSIATALAVTGALLGSCLLLVAAPAGRPRLVRAAGLGAVVLALALLGRTAHGDMFGRLLFREKYPRSPKVVRVIETRSGVCTVTADGRLYGGGVYDGLFRVDLRDDKNLLIRPASITAFRPPPERLLVIGLGTGSWARLAAAHPSTRKITIVEMNTGQITLLRERPDTAAFITDPRTTIVLDDARRWLKHHPHEKFDAAVMNTTLHWRAHSTNLLSREFLELVRAHLRPGGVVVYNATGSLDSYKTGASVYRHAVRVYNSMLVSDAPLVPDRARWRQTLLESRIDGRPLFDASRAEDLAALDRTLDLLHTLEQPNAGEKRMEPGPHILARLPHARVITDDNMASEWQQIK